MHHIEWEICDAIVNLEVTSADNIFVAKKRRLALYYPKILKIAVDVKCDF